MFLVSGLGETRKGLRPGMGWNGGLAELIPHASLLRRSFFTPSAQHGGANEGALERIFWLLACLLPAFTAGEAIG
jgi:hypothetical protein